MPLRSWEIMDFRDCAWEGWSFLLWRKTRKHPPPYLYKAEKEMGKNTWSLQTREREKVRTEALHGCLSLEGPHRIQGGKQISPHYSVCSIAGSGKCSHFAPSAPRRAPVSLAHSDKIWSNNTSLQLKRSSTRKYSPTISYIKELWILTQDFWDIRENETTKERKDELKKRNKNQGWVSEL